MSCCNLTMHLCVPYNLLLPRDVKYSYKTSFLELNLTMEVSAKEQALLSISLVWVFFLPFFFFFLPFFF